MNLIYMFMITIHYDCKVDTIIVINIWSDLFNNTVSIVLTLRNVVLHCARCKKLKRGVGGLRACWTKR